MQTNRSGQARAVLNEVQSRHDDIKKIEKTILDLHQLFMDMQMMVEQQGVVLDQVEVHAESTAHDLEQGNRDVARAIGSAKATRAVSFWKKNRLFVLISLFASTHRKNGAALSSLSSS
jgi:syntaxin 1B/2/3